MRTKKSKFALTAAAAATALALGLSLPAHAALQAVGPVSADNGFPIWYEDSNNLRLDACLAQNGFCLSFEPNPAAPISFPGNFGPEIFYWSADATITDGVIDTVLVLAVEGAFATPTATAGQQQTFTRIQFGPTPVPAPGNYTITHPFGETTVTAVADGQGGFEIARQRLEIGCLGAGPTCNFADALANGAPGVPSPGIVNADGRTPGPFLRPSATPGGAASPAIVTPGGTFIANPNTLTAVTGSPTGNNFFRIVGPGVNVTQSLFNVMGQISGCSALNAAPVGVADIVAASSAAPVILNVLANDTDTVVDVATNTISQITPPIGTVTVATQPIGGTAVANPDGTITFTANAGVTGDVTFTYTVTDPCGLVSLPTTVTVGVDTMRVQKAKYRTKFGKWSINGISAFEGDTVTATMGPRATLTGAQEVPAVVTNATGMAVTAIGMNRDSISYTLTYDGLTAVSMAHIHSGAAGVNGPAQAFLCTNVTPPPAGVPAPPACPATAGTVTGTLTAANFIPVAPINTFAQFIDAILAGGTYANVHTEANPTGEIRGQITRSPLFTTTVTGGKWRAGGKTPTSPGKGPGNVMVESQTTGIIDNIELKKR